MTAHSHIGASSMYRWSACPGSVRLSRNLPPQPSSSYAEEGTLAHEVAAAILNGKGCPQGATAEMVEAVRVYTDEVLGQRNKTLMVEQRFNLSSIHDGLFGTADAVIYSPKTKLLRVYDYKHGAGIAVEVENNPQLLYYGLGALLNSNFSVNEVEMVVVQPRCNHPDGPIRRWRVGVMDVLEFAADLKQYAVATEDPNAPLVAGDHCRFCPAAGTCPELQKQAQALAKNEFRADLSYDPSTLSDVLNKLPVLEAFIKNVREFAYAEAEHGRVPPGFKLVEKRATRGWQDETEVKRFAEDYLKRNPNKGYWEFIEEKLKSPAQVEKILGKGVIDHLVVSKSSGMTLAPCDDRRPAARLDAKSVFSDEA